MDPFSLAIGGGLLALGYVVGRLTRRKPTQPALSATCDCSHPLALHDAATNTCHGQIPQPKTYNDQGDYLGTVYVQCPCHQYVGPRPIEDIVSQHYLPPAA